MGRGNACVHNPYEGLFYIDNDYLHSYRRVGCDAEDECTVLASELGYSEISSGNWVFDEFESRCNYDWAIDWFKSSFKKRFKSFSDCDQWISRYEHAILENTLFYIVVEDNEWSVAIKLIQKEDWLLNLDGLQAKHYQSYLNGMKDCLFEQFDELGTYGGPWTSGRIRKVAS